MDVRDHPNVHILDHPLIKHKVAYLRDINTGSKDFRDIVSEIASLMAYEAFKDVKTEDVEIQTPFEKVHQTVIQKDSIVLVPILRAGLAMIDGILAVYPMASFGHIGLRRDEMTHEPVEYMTKFPEWIGDRIVMVLDPMLATGGSSSAAISILKEHGCKRIKLLSIVAAPEGLERVAKEHPEVEIFLSVLDRELNEDCYILPGLGDAGDRIFGT